MFLFVCISADDQLELISVPHLNRTFRTVADSVVDPDPHGSTFILVSYIRVRIENVDMDSDPGGQKWPTKKLRKMYGIVLKCYMFSFEV
jgi:hypothetical protein